MYRSIIVDVPRCYNRHLFCHVPTAENTETESIIINLCRQLTSSSCVDVARTVKNFFSNHPIHLFMISTQPLPLLIYDLSADLSEGYDMNVVVDNFVQTLIDDMGSGMDKGTRHVLMSTIMANLMDLAECVVIPRFFSHRGFSSIKDAFTYYEIALSRMLRRKLPSRLKERQVPVQEQTGRRPGLLNFEIVYDVSKVLDKYYYLSSNNMLQWRRYCWDKMLEEDYVPEMGLNKLYQLSIPNRNDLFGEKIHRRRK